MFGSRYPDQAIACGDRYESRTTHQGRSPRERACLHDRVVEDAELLDAGVIFGTGFAPFRGGPIQYIRDTGADALISKLEALAARHGERFTPRPGWDSPELRT